MAFLNLATLEAWVEEFREQGYDIPGTIRVIPQDGEQGADTGLVSAGLASVSTVVYIQPAAVDADEWCVTFEARTEPVSMDPATVVAMANELTVIAALCSFLEGRARGHAADEA